MDAKYLPMSEELLSVQELRRIVSDAVLSAEAAFHVGRRDYSDAFKAALLQRLKEHQADYTLIRVRGELAGFYCFFRDGDRMVICDMYIFPKWRCCGLARKALDRCVSSTELPVHAYTYTADPFSWNLYANNGFRWAEAVNASISRLLNDNCDPF